MQSPRPPEGIYGRERFRWTRRTALQFWSRGIALLSLLATSAIALGAAFHGLLGTLTYTLLGLALVLALPALWITVARIAERRYFARPPKRFLAAVLGFDVSGVALVAAAVLLLQSETVPAASVFTAGGVLEGCGTLLLLLWFAAARLVAPTGHHMLSL